MDDSKLGSPLPAAAPKQAEPARDVQRSAHRGAGIRARETARKAIGPDLIKRVQQLLESGNDD